MLIVIICLVCLAIFALLIVGIVSNKSKTQSKLQSDKPQASSLNSDNNLNATEDEMESSASQPSGGDKNLDMLLNIGNLRKYGLHVPQDYKKAVEYFFMAAEQGHAEMPSLR